MITVNTWKYKGKLVTDITDMPEGTYGFIYQITHKSTGKKYIGKKVLSFERTKKLTKKELAEHTGKGRKPTTKKVQSESDWKTYFGSNKEFLELIKAYGEQHFEREILEYVPSKKLLTYFECKYLFSVGAIEPNSLYYNDNLLGKFFRKDFL
jgi:hypothetical protein